MVIINIFQDLINKGVLTKGSYNLQLFENIHFSMYPARAFAVALNRLYIDKDINYIKKLGRIMGDNSAMEFYNVISKMEGLIKKEYTSIPSLIEMSGFGRVDKFIKKGNKYVLQVKNHPVIVPAIKLYGEKNFVCDFYGEVYAAYIQIFKKVSLLNVNHTKCVSKGDEACEWVFIK